MRAIVQTGFGLWRLRCKEIERPQPGEKDVLVRVRASSLNFADVLRIEGGPWFARPVTMFMKPGDTIPGTDVAGEVEAVGAGVTRFRPGDRVYANLAACGRGGFAEFARAPEDILARMPANLSFDEAAAVPQAAGVALQGLCDLGRLHAGQSVLVQGASGGIGTFAVQIAQALGADVTGVCSGRNCDLVRSLGANRVIDYKRMDFTREGRRYDLILAIKGYHSLRAYEACLTETGRYVMIGGSWAQIFEAGARASREGNRGRVAGLSYKPRREDWERLTEWIEAGKVRPVVDRVYPLDKLGDAIRNYDRARTRGKVVVSIG